MMSKKHYEAIANRIALVSSGTKYLTENTAARGHQRGVVELASVLADYFATENPRFDRERFLAACGVQS